MTGLVLLVLGEFCETEINECLSSPCQNEAVCEDKIGRYLCHCVNTGDGHHYTGPQCQDKMCDVSTGIGSFNSGQSLVGYHATNTSNITLYHVHCK